jgi:hypothetical protein
MWVLNSRGKAKKASAKKTQTSMSTHTGIEVAIFDPRQSSNPSIYSVRFRCSAANLKKLNNDHPGAQKKISTLAKQHPLVLDWKEPRRMCVRKIPVNPDDLTNTWEEVAEAAVELLRFLQKVEAAVGSGS